MFRTWDAGILLAVVAVLAAMFAVLPFPHLAYLDMPLALAALGLVSIIILSKYRVARRVTACLAVLTLCAVLSRLAFAQTTVTSTAPSETTINVGQLLAPWLQYLMGAAVALILALFGWITAVINKRAGLEGNAAVLQIEAHARELLETALTNAAGSLVMKAGAKLDGMTIDAKSPLVVQGVNQINTWAQSAVVKFGLSPDDLAKKLIDKVGVLTAANPTVTPTTRAST